MANFDWNDADSADLVQKVFTGEINIANLPIELYEKTANYLTQGVFDVYGIGYDQSIMMPEFETVRHLKANITVFSSAKTFQSILDMQSQLLDENGNIRSFAEFEKRASKIESLYNRAWLKAEYRTTINQARSAKNWDRYSSQKNTFPYLRYETKDDSKVRPEHASMDGITLPVDHEFWNQYFPPNGWNCRCTITQIRKATPTKLDQIGTTDDGTPEFKGVTLPDQLFRLNSGKHQVIFVDDKQKGLSHPYFKVDTRYKAYQDRNFDMPIPNDVKDLIPVATEIKPPVIQFDDKKFKTIDDRIEYIKTESEKYANPVHLETQMKMDDILAKKRGLVELSKYATGEKRSQIIADFKKLCDEYDELSVLKDSQVDKYTNDVIGLLFSNNGSANALIDTVSKSVDKTQVKTGFEYFNKIVGNKLIPNDVKIKVGLDSNRAGYVSSTIKINKKETFETICHELGHMLEDKNAQYFNKIKQYYQQRTKDYPIQRLKDLTGKNYKKTELTKADKFWNPYTGKQYFWNVWRSGQMINDQHGTEITSMWFTHALSDLNGFIKNDFDHFQFVFKLFNE